jgi:uncharacterized protein (TIGR03435 family)
VRHRILWMVCAGMVAASAQSQTESNRLAFEVASVRPGKPIEFGIGLPKPMPGGQRYVATNAPVMAMMMGVYRLTDSQILGAPQWMIFDPWDVDARAEHPSTPEQLQEMFQTLLAERFKLRFHRETKELAAYVLSVDKSGSKLKRSDAKDAFDEPIKPGDRPGVLVGSSASMSYLCWRLSFNLDAPVVDQTSLAGSYDFILDRPAAQALLLQPQGTPETAGPRLEGPERNADLITALHEQLGLKLEYRKAPVEVFVIDDVERPTDN